MRIAVLVKQIPMFEAMELGPDGRLVREGLELEMNAYCRRAVSQGVALAAEHGGRVTVLTLGPPAAEDALREAIAWGLDREVAIDGVLVTDPVCAGSDTLATARALAAALEREGPFDLVLTGRNSVDADTGQVGPELAQLLDLPFATGVRELVVSGDVAHVRCELDDGWLEADVSLPAVLSTAERLIDPCKVEPEGRAAVPADLIRVVDAAALGPGPWGQAASPTRVGPIRVLDIARRRHLLPDAPLAEQVRAAVAVVVEQGALDRSGDAPPAGVVPTTGGTGPVVGIVVERDREGLTRELLGAAARLASTLGGSVTAIVPGDLDAGPLGAWGADTVTTYGADLAEEDVAALVTAWARLVAPWAVLATSTTWGREVASRAAAALGAGLTGDAVDLEVDHGRLVSWKPAFGGRMVAAIEASSPVQMATVRGGMLPVLEPRAPSTPVAFDVTAPARRRVRVLARTRDDDLDVLADAAVVVGVGQGIPPEHYPAIDPLLTTVRGVLGATRKVTDQGWLPRARQIGITGRSIAPRLYIALGLSGKFNHMVGVRSARTILAINSSPDALVFDVADAGIVGDWREALPLLVEELRAADYEAASSGVAEGI
jgi:electron transfer flavoprotein alpha subunit